MKVCVTCFKGTEDICAKEIVEVISKELDVKEGCILFDANKEDIAKLCYNAQTVNRVVALAHSYEYKDASEVKKKIEDIDKILYEINKQKKELETLEKDLT